MEKIESSSFRFPVLFIFGLTQIFKTQAFITPVFLTSFMLLFCSLLFWLMNLKEQRAWLLIIMVGIQLSWAFSDVFFTVFISHYLPSATDLINSKLIGIISLSVFYLLTAFAVYTLFILKDKNKIPFSVLTILLILSVFLVFTDQPVIFKLSVILFSLTYFFFGQTGSAMETKTLRVVSYQFLLLGLLQCFEYFL
ncbi:MAG: hypothetical protein IPM77_06320 [Crocinitomicaceae bacterium]|nr:hypothetical protein [Crocinitomicaceae bacterium]